MQLLDRDQVLRTPPLWRLAFRPFFLGAALFALLAVPLWLMALQGLAGTWQPAGGWLIWHRHEMPFGFGLAVVAGFLLTAVQNWTGQPGLQGRPLVILVLLWLAGRVAWLMPVPVSVLLVVELAFPLLLCAAMAQHLWRARLRRNYPVVAVLALLVLADVLSVLGLLWQQDNLSRQGIQATLWLLAAMVTLIGGRVIPFFTSRGLCRERAPAAQPRLDQALLSGMMAMAVLHAAGVALAPQPLLTVPLLALAAGHAQRCWHWWARGVLAEPLLWSLHMAYAWLPLACAGLALWHAGVVFAVSLAWHALTVGTLAGLIMAMMARVSLGHTGRALQAPRGLPLAFGLLQLAALFRVVLALWMPLGGWWLAAICWSAAFALFVWRYAPILCAARVDGQAG